MKYDKYFDNNATTRLIPEVKQAITDLFDIQYGNPSSPHSFGVKATELIYTAKENTSKFFNCSIEDVLFTSCATESNTMVLQSILSWKGEEKKVVTTPVEHSSIKKNCEILSECGVSVLEVPVSQQGLVDIEKLSTFLKQDDITLVSIGWVNSETGVIQPIEMISELCRNAGVPLHVDATQAVGRIAIDLEEIPVDYLVFTGHKIHAPKGIGGLISKHHSSLRSVVWGGEQQNGMRAGTENLLGIHALGIALRTRQDTMMNSVQYLSRLRDKFEHAILELIPIIKINGSTEQRVCNTSNLCFGSIDGRAIVAQLDNVGVICSQTSACTSQIPEPSPTLLSMGLSEEEAFGSIRVSFAVDNTAEEVEAAIPLFDEVLTRVRSFASL